VRVVGFETILSRDAEWPISLGFLYKTESQAVLGLTQVLQKKM